MKINQKKIAPSFGLIIEPGSIDSIFDLDSEEISHLFKTYRTLHFKNWDLRLEDFQKLSARLCKNLSSYEGGGFRFKQLDRSFVNADKTIMTTTGHTQGFSIPLHGEMHYMGKPPPLIWFYCQTAVDGTGQTTICDGHELASQLSQRVKSYFDHRKIKYLRHLPDGSWQNSFLTDNVEKAMEICRKQKVAFKYDKDKNQFTTEYVVSPFVENGYIAGPKFINNILNIYTVEWAFESGWIKNTLDIDIGDQCPMVVRMEDGTRIPVEIIAEIKEIAESNTIDIAWNNGEVLMIDNLSVMHGRRESLNPAREVYVRMGDANF